MSELIDRLEKATAWRAVEGFLYEVSDTGIVRSTRSKKMLRPSLSHNGYEHVMFSVAKVRTTFRVHRLVAAAFLGQLAEAMHVNHLDGRKRNNVVSNLEVVTRAENEAHAVLNNLKAAGPRNGTKTKPDRVARGSRAGLAKLSGRDVITIRSARAAGAKLQELAMRFSVDQSLISLICRRKIWTHI